MSNTQKNLADLLKQPKDDGEPALRHGVVGGLATALLSLVVSFGLDLSAEQQTAIYTVVIFGLPIFIALWNRRKVWSPKSVYDLYRELSGYMTTSQLDKVINPVRTDKTK